jgi:hypothetical protein
MDTNNMLTMISILPRIMFGSISDTGRTDFVSNRTMSVKTLLVDADNEYSYECHDDHYRNPWLVVVRMNGLGYYQGSCL